MISLCVLPGSVCSSRTLILFTFGCTLAVVLMTFQYEHKLLLFNSPRLMLTLPSLSLISICGLGAAVVGFVYPNLIASMDRTRSFENNDETSQKSQLCKSLVLFVGINHLCAKIPFQSDLHFTITVVCLCIGFWWIFDGSIIGFLFSMLVSLLLTMATEILLRAGAFQYENSNFYLKTCVPCLTFAGAILTIQMSKLLSQNPHSYSSRISIEEEHFKTD